MTHWRPYEPLLDGGATPARVRTHPYSNRVGPVITLLVMDLFGLLMFGAMLLSGFYLAIPFFGVWFVLPWYQLSRRAFELELTPTTLIARSPVRQWEMPVSEVIAVTGPAIQNRSQSVHISRRDGSVVRVVVRPEVLRLLQLLGTRRPDLPIAIDSRVEKALRAQLFFRTVAAAFRWLAPALLTMGAIGIAVTALGLGRSWQEMSAIEDRSVAVTAEVEATTIESRRVVTTVAYTWSGEDYRADIEPREEPEVGDVLTVDVDPQHPDQAWDPDGWPPHADLPPDWALAVGFASFVLLVLGGQLNASSHPLLEVPA